MDDLDHIEAFIFKLLYCIKLVLYSALYNIVQCSVGKAVERACIVAKNNVSVTDTYFCAVLNAFLPLTDSQTVRTEISPVTETISIGIFFLENDLLRLLWSVSDKRQPGVV